LIKIQEGAMKKSKVILSILLIILLSVLLAGCGEVMDFILGGWAMECCDAMVPLPIAAICIRLFM
jgi:hypothetical protein